MFLCSLRYCLKCYFSKGVYSFTLSTVFVKNVYIILLSSAYKNIKCYGSSHSSHEILTNWLINVDNSVQRQSALLNISDIKIYLYTINLYIF